MPGQSQLLNISMNVLISGCSFTHWPETPEPDAPNICWPKHLQDIEPTWMIKNVAEPAAGNQYICESVIREIVENPNTKYDCVLVMWSGVSRLDYLTSLEDPAWDEMYDSYGFYRRVASASSKLGYIFSGGQLGTWYNNPVAEKMFREMYKVSSPLSLATINIMEMIKLQNFLENKKINYRFMSYVNYWGDEDNVSRNGDFAINKFPEIQGLLSEFDWSKWIFTDENRNGLNELAVANNDFQEDEFHPGNATQAEWAKLVYQQLQQ